MTIVFADGFDCYEGDPGKAPAWAKTSFNGKSLDRKFEPYGFEFVSDEGDRFKVHVERTESDNWRMTVEGKGELVFAQQPTFTAFPG